MNESNVHMLTDTAERQNKANGWDSLAVQRLGLHILIAKGLGSTLDRGTRIPQATRPALHFPQKNC